MMEEDVVTFFNRQHSPKAPFRHHLLTSMVLGQCNGASVYMDTAGNSSTLT
jgi:hypothetical protein